MKQPRKPILVLLASMLASACGGGGGSTTPTAPGNVTMTVSGKSLNFQWTAGSNVDHYRILVNPDGVSGFVAVPGADTIPGTATGHTLEIPVHKTNWAAAQYLVESCNADNSACEASPNQTLKLIDSIAATEYVKASNTGVGDEFGFAVALSGDGSTLVVGSAYEDSAATGIDGDQADNTVTNSGAVYVFTRSAGAWQQQAYVKASNADADDRFGWSVALSDDGNTLAVGAYAEDSAATGIDGDQSDNTASAAGAVYVFTRTAGAWKQQAYVKASNAGAGDEFGWSVALSADGNTLAVGALFEDSAATGVGGNQADNTSGNSGAAYVFTRSAGTWTQQAYIKASNTGGGDWFGRSVALSGDGDTLAVGAVYEDSATTGVGGDQTDNTAGNAGAVYVFTRTAGTWKQQAYVKASNTDAGDQFGFSVALNADGDTLAVGALYEDSAATGIDGDRADNAATNSGAAYVFTRAADAWKQQAYVKASNTDAEDRFGWSVALSGDGDTLAVGALFEDSAASGVGGGQADNTATNSGAAYVFTRAAGIWKQQAYVKASNTGGSDWFGQSLALSGDGDTLAVGAVYEDSAATGIGGDQADNTASHAGAVYVY